MANEFQGLDVHSAEYFGDSRDHWYSPDFLPLLAARWELDRVQSVLDVGCGAGHWGRVVGSLLPATARMVGLDREAVWVEAAGRRAQERGLGDRWTFQQGAAEALPFPDDSFDLVTCQTVLIHCPDPRAVVAEMMRVTRPGGRVAVCEPNNLAGPLLQAAALELPVDDVLDLVRIQLCCERGKRALGEGDVSLGELVPGLFWSVGLRDVQAFQNDRCNLLVPPYKTLPERLYIEEMESFAARGIWMWSRADSERYYLAGGGAPADFDRLWDLAGRVYCDMLEQLRAGTFVGVGGQLNYLVSGRKGEAAG